MKFRKKPVVIEAARFVTVNQAAAFIRTNGGSCHLRPPGAIGIETLEGVMWAGVGDWIIKGVVGELYPCKDQIFRTTYEPVDGKDSE